MESREFSFHHYGADFAVRCVRFPLDGGTFIHFRLGIWEIRGSSLGYGLHFYRDGLACYPPRTFNEMSALSILMDFTRYKMRQAGMTLSEGGRIVEGDTPFPFFGQSEEVLPEESAAEVQSERSEPEGPGLDEPARLKEERTKNKASKLDRKGDLGV